MRGLTEQETAEWLAVRGYKPIRDWRPWLDTESYKLPPDAGSKNFLAACLAEAFYEMPGEVLLEVDDWSVWTSSDNPELFAEYRAFLGEKRPLSEVRFHLFGPEEKTALRNLLNLCLLFFYDVKVLQGKTGSRFFASHDEVCHLGLGAEKRAQFLREWFQRPGG